MITLPHHIVLCHKEHDFSDTDDLDIILNQKGGGALDEKLFKMLKA